MFSSVCSLCGAGTGSHLQNIFPLDKLFTTPPGRFRLVAALEGISFLVLLCIAMPLKYIWGQPQMVQSVGMAHGVLFVLYVVGVVLCREMLGWNLRQTGLAMALSVVPFGTFYVTARMMPKKETVSETSINGNER